MNLALGRAGVVLGLAAAVFGAITVAIGTYAAWILRRARRAAEQVPADRRRWSES